MNLTNSHVLITGGTDGIGLALAEQVARAGARVTACGRDVRRLSAARERLGPTVHFVQCDVADAGHRARLLVEAREANGPLDVLVNNAGVQQLMNFRQPGQMRTIASEIAINLTAPLLLTEAVLPELLARPAAVIVQVTSGLALSPKANAPVYCATKSGLRSFTRALRWQLEGTPVCVIEALLPIVDTAMTRGRGHGKISADDAAREILRALRSGREEAFIGKTKLLRGLMGLSPSLAARVTRRM